MKIIKFVKKLNQQFVGKILYLIPIVIFVFGLFSCGDDEDDPIPVSVDISSLEGEWVSELGSGEMVQITFGDPGNHSVSMVDYQDYQCAMIQEGEWVYISESGTLILRVRQLASGYSEVFHYRIDKLEKDILVLTDEDLGITREYKRVRDAYTIYQGQSIDILISTEWEITNNAESIVQVSDATVKGISYGTAFIRTSYNGKSWYIRIVVNPDFFPFLKLATGTLNDVRSTLGTPDASGLDSHNMPAVVYYDPIPGISDVMFNFDGQTISRTYIWWDSETDFKNSEKYVRSNYTPDGSGRDAYFDGLNLHDSTFSIGIIAESKCMFILNLAYIFDSTQD